MEKIFLKIKCGIWKSSYRKNIIFLAQFCPTICSPMDCRTPGFPVLYYLPELAQTHVYWRWCGTTISSSFISFSSHLQSFLASLCRLLRLSFLLSRMILRVIQVVACINRFVLFMLNSTDYRIIGRSHNFLSIQALKDLQNFVSLCDKCE